MQRNTVNGLAPSAPLTLANARQRAAELLELQSQMQAQRPKPALDPPSRSPQAPQSSFAPPKQSTNPACPAEPWELGEAALYGCRGLAVRTIAPHTEAHPAAILLQLLAVFGNLVGPGPHCMVDATRHGLNLFVVLVGDSSKARKGTSWGQIARLFAEVDHPWLSTRVTTARLTAGGLIHALRDQQPPTDRRLLALSEEFASVLHTLKRGKATSRPCSAAPGIAAISPPSICTSICKPPERISASSPTSPSVSSPKVSTTPKPTTALPTAASGPGCSAATAFPRVETSPQRSLIRRRPRTAPRSRLGRRHTRNPLLAATKRRASFGTIAIPP